jgi:hypothetical protein
MPSGTVESLKPIKPARKTIPIAMSEVLLNFEFSFGYCVKIAEQQQSQTIAQEPILECGD